MSDADRRNQARRDRLAAERAAAASAARRSRLIRLLLVLGAAGVVVAVAIVVSSTGSPKPRAPVRQAGEVVAGQKLSAEEFAQIPQSGLVLGRATAPVTLVEVADLKCPVCRQYAAQSEPVYIQDYVRTGKVRLELRLVDIIGGPDSTRATLMAAAAAQQNRLWNFGDLFYRNQRDENQQYVTPGFVRTIALGVPDLNVDKALAARSGPKARAYLTSGLAMVDRYAINSTPTFLIGPTGGALRKIDSQSTPFNALGPVIDAELKKAA